MKLNILKLNFVEKSWLLRTGLGICTLLFILNSNFVYAWGQASSQSNQAKNDPWRSSSSTNSAASSQTTQSSQPISTAANVQSQRNNFNVITSGDGDVLRVPVNVLNFSSLVEQLIESNIYKSLEAIEANTEQINANLTLAEHDNMSVAEVLKDVVGVLGDLRTYANYNNSINIDQVRIDSAQLRFTQLLLDRVSELTDVTISNNDKQAIVQAISSVLLEMNQSKMLWTKDKAQLPSSLSSSLISLDGISISELENGLNNAYSHSLNNSYGPFNFSQLLKDTFTSGDFSINDVYSGLAIGSVMSQDSELYSNSRVPVDYSDNYQNRPHTIGATDWAENLPEDSAISASNFLSPNHLSNSNSLAMQLVLTSIANPDLSANRLNPSDFVRARNSSDGDNSFVLRNDEYTMTKARRYTRDLFAANLSSYFFNDIADKRRRYVSQEVADALEISQCLVASRNQDDCMALMIEEGYYIPGLNEDNSGSLEDNQENRIKEGAKNVCAIYNNDDENSSLFSTPQMSLICELVDDDRLDISEYNKFYEMLTFSEAKILDDIGSQATDPKAIQELSEAGIHSLLRSIAIATQNSNKLQYEIYKQNQISLMFDIITTGGFTDLRAESDKAEEVSRQYFGTQ